MYTQKAVTDLELHVHTCTRSGPGLSELRFQNPAAMAIDLAEVTDLPEHGSKSRRVRLRQSPREMGQQLLCAGLPIDTATGGYEIPDVFDQLLVTGPVDTTHCVVREEESISAAHLLDE